MIQKEVALFIPCFNERARLKIMEFQHFIHENKEFMDFYFIDDGSNDGTSDLIKEHLADNSDSFLIKLEKNHGKGNALRKAILQKNAKPYDFIAFIDADLEIPLMQVNKLYSTIKKSEFFLVTSRRNLSKEFTYKRLRSVSSLIMVFIANKIIGAEPALKDTQCGCKLFRTEITELCFGNEFISDWLFDIEILLRLKSRYPEFRKKIYEVPVNWKSEGNSNFHFMKNFKVLGHLYRINSYYN